MTKGQKRLAALVLVLMGIYGTLIATGDRVYQEQQIAAQSESVAATEAVAK